MQAASDAIDTGMVSVIGLDSDKVKELCGAASEKSGAKIQIANYLCKGNYAVSGASSACDAVAEIAKPEKPLPRSDFDRVEISPSLVSLPKSTGSG